MNKTWTEQEQRTAAQIAVHLQKLTAQAGRLPKLAALDGRCASGKTTAAEILHRQYGWPVVHADDFFLRPEQRTPERYAEPGGNIDWERLREEVLIPLREGKPVSYRRFDCSCMKLGDTIILPASNLVLIEGSYSLHPKLRDLYDLKLFLTVSPKEQLRRIEERNGSEKLIMFKERWIPLEELYFSSCGSCEIADVCLNTSYLDQN